MQVQVQVRVLRPSSVMQVQVQVWVDAMPITSVIQVEAQVRAMPIICDAGAGTSTGVGAMPIVCYAGVGGCYTCRLSCRWRHKCILHPSCVMWVEVQVRAMSIMCHAGGSTSACYAHRL